MKVEVMAISLASVKLLDGGRKITAAQIITSIQSDDIHAPETTFGFSGKHHE
jgi:hypothetical protein